MSPSQINTCEVAIIGAGPYGLSVAAHLSSAGIATRVFGEPMGFWRQHMPKGMILRSPWRATHLSDPQNALSLDAYAFAHGVDSSKALPLEKFVAYGQWFQQHAVPGIDCRAVRSVEATRDGFRLQIADGEVLSADRVVVATGLRNQEYRPPMFKGLPAGLVSHASEHADLSKFRGKRVAVIGRGQSATESAALLSEAGAAAEIISRGPIHWLGLSASAASEKTLRRRLRKSLAAPSEIGPFPLSWGVEVPDVIRLLPPRVREAFTRRCLKAAAAGWLKPRFADVACNSGRTIRGVRRLGDCLALDLDYGSRTYDHVLLGTGYRVDISRLGLLAPSLIARIACADGSPLLGSEFESSVPKLHFVGSYAVKSFGPLLRFIAGAPYAARKVTEAALLRAVPSRASAADYRAFAGVAVPNPWPPQ